MKSGSTPDGESPTIGLGRTAVKAVLLLHIAFFNGVLPWKDSVFLFAEISKTELTDLIQKVQDLLYR